MAKTRVVSIGGLKLGGGNPIRVQSMCNTSTRDVAATVAQIKRLEAAGCELVRVAVPDMESARALAGIKAQINIPLIADIHYEPALALASIPYVDKLRLNPGTMPKAKLAEIIAAARHIPIRVGINSGSLERGFLGTRVEQMLASVEQNIRLLKSKGFSDIVVALKSSEVNETIEAYRRFSRKYDYPLHLGLTEAGSGSQGLIKSAICLGVLLKEGIGDTIRVSLTGDPVNEVKAAYDILRAVGLRKRGIEFVSCPTCGRTSVDLEPIVNQIKQELSTVIKPIKVAIMGCEVNGPGEAKEADFGLAFSKARGYIFSKGKILKQVPVETAVAEFVALIKGS